MYRLIIVEPWFTAIGHPAQSLLNTARIVGRRQDVCYLISWEKGQDHFRSFADEIGRYGQVHRFPVVAPAHSVNTLLGLLWSAKIAGRLRGQVDVFFLDAHLTTLAAAHRALRLVATNIRLLSVMQLFGPEAVLSASWRHRIIAKWLAGGNKRLFLRTQELCEAWRKEIPGESESRIDTLPSLEIPDDEDPPPSATRRVTPRFGVLGQIRSGKGLEWLVPLFSQNHELGDLQVCGGFSSEADQRLQTLVMQLPEFHNRYVSEKELLAAASSLDYILTLYEAWDHRLEAATFYLAARARRPVICYDIGWCGRMVREFRCGIALNPATTPSKEIFLNLPKRDSRSYQELVVGMEAFRVAHCGNHRREEFMRKIVGESVASV